LNVTPTTDSEYPSLCQAIGKAKELRDFVQESVLGRTNAAHLEWLQQHVTWDADDADARLTFNGVTQCVGVRQLVHYGILRKVFHIIFTFCRAYFHKACSGERIELCI
jgi:hypothetical protein